MSLLGRMESSYLSYGEKATEQDTGKREDFGLGLGVPFHMTSSKDISWDGG